VTVGELHRDTIEIYIHSLPDEQVVFWQSRLQRNIETGDWSELDKIFEVLTATRQARCIYK